MNINDIITLAKAGFTAEQITRLAKPEVAPAPAPEAPKEAAPAPAPEAPKETAPDIAAVVSAEIDKAFKPFEELYNNMAKLAGAPSLGSVEPKGIDDIISDFFKEE